MNSEQLRKQAASACLERRRRKSYGEDVDTTPEGFATVVVDIYEPEIEKREALLHCAYHALANLKRAGLPLHLDWPAEADEVYDAIGEHLYPDSEVVRGG